ncbi:hypothetical protein ACFFX1_32705 [Dactylosporangium sucinum]|uniref:5'-methylthioadenosine/S-adenosylhomocysteine nucleosidase family protein n=1 Tax=Dactylosporangium sucinum TaxID=1424081 RepID=UPI00167DF711|nr:hypothetical protein [Dactylosporangium sucinum]
MLASSPAPLGPPRPPGWRGCWEAARSVRSSPFWRQVRDVVRPPGTAIHRSRPPLGLLLSAAARDGRLVWRSAGEFAVIEPPIARKRDWAGSDAGRSWLARLDRWWDHLVFAVPAFAALMLSVPVAFVPGVGLAACLFLILLALLYVTVQLGFGLIRFPRSLRVSPEDSARGLHWTVTLCHVSDAAHLDRLMRAALDRSRKLAAASMRPDPADGTHVLMCLESGVTTEEARRALTTAPSVVSADPIHSGVFVVRDGRQFRPPNPDAQRPLGGVALLLVATMLALAVTAVLVANGERGDCTDRGDCADRPATWLDAVYWQVSNMFFQDSGLVAATGQARLFGWLMRLLGLVVLFSVGVAIWRQARYHRERRAMRYRHIGTTIEASVRMLITVVLDTERDAIIEAFAEAGGAAAEPDTAGSYPIFRLGRLGPAEIFLAQAAQGTATPASMTLTASGLIAQLGVDYVVLAGICFGLWSRELDGGDQELGDVIVSDFVQGVDHRRVTDRGGTERILWRGERVQSTTALLLAFRAATHRWTGPRVHFGTVLSSNTLVDSAAFRSDLRREFPEASAGEMELTGLYAAAASNGCGWIMVKGISDWGAGGLTDDTRRSASRSAAAFVVRAITHGTLPAPRRHVRDGQGGADSA